MKTEPFPRTTRPKSDESRISRQSTVHLQAVRACHLGRAFAGVLQELRQTEIPAKDKHRLSVVAARVKYFLDFRERTEHGISDPVKCRGRAGKHRGLTYGPFAPIEKQ